MKRSPLFLLSLSAFFLLSQNLMAADTIHMGGMVKKTSGTVLSIDVGDVACYLSLTDAAGKKFTEMADFGLCDHDDLIGKRVKLTYKIEQVLADECNGNPECKKSRSVPIVSSVAVEATKK